MTDATATDGAPTARQRLIRFGLLAVVLALVAMWVYAFVFAPRSGVNPVRDKAWTTGAEVACTEAQAELAPLVFKTKITDDNKATELPRFVASLDKSTKVFAALLDRLAALPRASRKAVVLVPQWLADYAVYLKDVETWVDQLRTGKLAKFGVSITNTGIPVDERINTFAIENRIRACTTNELAIGGGSGPATAAQSTTSQP